MPFDAPAAIPITAAVHHALAVAADGFLGMLDPPRRSRAQYRFDAPQRRDWHYVPRRRPGLALAEMNIPQRRAAYRLLETALSERGYWKALRIMDLEALVDAMDPDEHYDPQDYAFAVFGEPQLGPPWGWRVEGHHLSLNFFLVNDELLAVTPSFMGAQPARVHDGEMAGLEVLEREQHLAREIVRGLDEALRARVLIAERAFDDILSGPGREASLLRPEGVPLAEFDEVRRDAVVALVEEYARRLRPELADHEMERLRQGGLDGVHLAWAGSLEPGQPHYYRLHGPTLLIEYDNTQDGANHVHTVWHQPGAAFGGDALADHYRHGHHHHRHRHHSR